ncbi:M20 family metallo-hydrolase [Deferribacterales bacterium RsTz2092]|nr:peptidase M20 [Deferribacterales bacterium]
MADYISNKANELKKSIIGWRRDLHKHPEPGWTEFRTAANAIKRLKELGYTIKMGTDVIAKNFMMGLPKPAQLEEAQARAISQGADEQLVKAMTGGLTGFTAEMKFSDDSTKFGLRFDMDSNDLTECNEFTHRPVKEGFASINTGATHACGHDAHVAVGVHTAEIVAGMKDKLKGTVRFIFQPAEEGLRGAGPMVAAGVTKDLNYILGMHVSFQANANGKLVCGGKGFLASTKWDVTFKGQSAHAGAAPQDGHNALLAAAAATLNMHAISRHSGGVTRINVGKMIAGEGRNVVPPNALLVMETRGETSELNSYMVKESERIVKAAADMYACTHSIEVTGGSESGQSDEKMIDIVEKAAKEIPYYTDITRLANFGAGEDYATMMSSVQEAGGIGTYVQVGIDRTAGHHDAKFDINEDGLVPATELMARSVYNVLKR